jgi:hypothetical protein
LVDTLVVFALRHRCSALRNTICIALYNRHS